MSWISRLFGGRPKRHRHGTVIKPRSAVQSSSPDLTQASATPASYAPTPIAPRSAIKAEATAAAQAAREAAPEPSGEYDYCVGTVDSDLGFQYFHGPRSHVEAQVEAFKAVLGRYGMSCTYQIRVD